MKNLQLIPSTLRDESIVTFSFSYDQELIQTTNPIVQHYTPIWEVVLNKILNIMEICTPKGLYKN